ncbi:predicted protein [Histoplasma mississippiense (nom. inval.)]|uniref:predicted protein n=1 Tax=Ajellomyces capsulatus (strain NAm1 / WU24) TaxID=2059318 RepID=UPI000157C909|nr:predicted protein [Histoplasma mississippiense (nom. inval.)]EDN09644.1 predicted protein [Histoplasma mississippiense (nom. inval.)]
MRTRSQPISPNGFQSLEIAPRRRKAQTTATASTATKVTKPAAEASAKPLCPPMLHLSMRPITVL